MNVTSKRPTRSLPLYWISLWRNQSLLFSSLPIWVLVLVASLDSADKQLLASSFPVLEKQLNLTVSHYRLMRVTVTLSILKCFSNIYHLISTPGRNTRILFVVFESLIRNQSSILGVSRSQIWCLKDSYCTERCLSGLGVVNMCHSFAGIVSLRTGCFSCAQRFCPGFDFTTESNSSSRARRFNNAGQGIWYDGVIRKTSGNGCCRIGRLLRIGMETSILCAGDILSSYGICFSERTESVEERKGKAWD